MFGNREDWEKRFHAQIEYDQWFETRQWGPKIPYLRFPADCEVKIIPPFAGASCRFMIKRGSKSISVYLDCYGILGAMDKPYWEIYPYKGDTFRCWIDETNELLRAIEEELENEDGMSVWE